MTKKQETYQTSNIDGLKKAIVDLINEEYIHKEKVRELVLNCLFYSDTPTNRKPTKSEKEVAEMTVASYLEDIGFNEILGEKT